MKKNLSDLGKKSEDDGWHADIHREDIEPEPVNVKSYEPVLFRKKAPTYKAIQWDGTPECREAIKKFLGSKYIEYWNESMIIFKRGNEKESVKINDWILKKEWSFIKEHSWGISNDYEPVN